MCFEMIIVVGYDVNTETSKGRKRLRRVAEICEDYGQRVQKSVFECKVGDKEWIVFRNRLLAEINEKEDSLRFYFIDEASHRRTEHYGLGKPVDFDGPLIV
ncbi:MAG: CRISPR-associated endonuclease Cas2 [Elusimicrobiota bacterium]